MRGVAPDVRRLDDRNRRNPRAEVRGALGHDLLNAIRSGVDRVARAAELSVWKRLDHDAAAGFFFRFRRSPFNHLHRWVRCGNDIAPADRDLLRERACRREPRGHGENTDSPLHRSSLVVRSWSQHLIRARRLHPLSYKRCERSDSANPFQSMPSPRTSASTLKSSPIPLVEVSVCTADASRR